MHRELGGSSFAELGLPEGLERDAELEALLDATRIEAQASTRRLDSEQGRPTPTPASGATSTAIKCTSAATSRPA